MKTYWWLRKIGRWNVLIQSQIDWNGFERLALDSLRGSTFVFEGLPLLISPIYPMITPLYDKNNLKLTSEKTIKFKLKGKRNQSFFSFFFTRVCEPF